MSANITIKHDFALVQNSSMAVIVLGLPNVYFSFKHRLVLEVPILIIATATIAMDILYEILTVKAKYIFEKLWVTIKREGSVLSQVVQPVLLI